MKSFSRIVRRTHMYAALALTPWIGMYALSTLAMNHRPGLERWYGGDFERWELEREGPFIGSFRPGSGRLQAARAILSDLGLAGAHDVSAREEDGTFTILRRDPISPRRITYFPATRTIRIERQAFRTPALLERLHRRRGFREPGLWNTAWGLGVDAAILALGLWVASGLWMWWEMKALRRWGAVCLAGGAGLFTFFLLVL
ncbi:MAG: hypothetical protein ACE5HF_11080 [Gemmatimonadota bacterium]